MKCILLSICCALIALGGFALPIPARWTIDVSKADQSPAMIVAFQGETLSIEPTLTSVGVPLAFPTSSVVTFYWATNALGPWWTKDAGFGAVTGRLHATWSPTNDTGAAGYIFYLGVADTTGTIYRAYGRLMMRTSPGFNPVILPPPATLGDTLSGLSNLVYGSVQNVSNALADALLAGLIVASNYADTASAVARNSAITQAENMLVTGRAARATSADRVLQIDSNAWVDVVNGTATLWRVAADTNALVVTDSMVGTWGHVPAVGSVFRRSTSTTFSNACSDGVWNIALQTGTWWMWSPQPIGAMGGSPEGYYHAGFGDYYVTVAYASNAITNAYVLARIDDLPSLLPYATTNQLLAVSNLVVQAQAAAAAAATNSIDITARAGLTTRPTFAQTTNIVSRYAAPSFPVYDFGTHSNVTFVLSNSVLYLYGI